MVSKSQTITDADRFHNPHAGDMLASEFLEPSEMSVDALAEAIDVPAPVIQAVIAGEKTMDAALDLRLARYFRMSEGFFLRLQDTYELLEAKRGLEGALDRIVPRAA